MVKLTQPPSLSLSLVLQGMRNLSISCSLVSLIILGTNLVVFWIGLIEREVPPVLVVSVLYLLSGKNGRLVFSARHSGIKMR